MVGVTNKDMSLEAEGWMRMSEALDLRNENGEGERTNYIPIHPTPLLFFKKKK